MIYSDLIKEADLDLETMAKGFLSSIKDNVDFRNKPFETLFGVLGTSLAWKGGFIIGGLFTVAQLFGFGPGLIGKIIDDYFFDRGAKSVEDMDFSPSNIKGAAVSAASKIKDIIPDDLSMDVIVEKFKNLFASNLQELKEIKGVINSNDKKAIAYMTAYSVGFVKSAKPGFSTGIGRFIREWRRGRRLPLITGLLMKLIWAFVKGLIALGVVGGAAKMVGLRPSKTAPMGHGEFKTYEEDYGPGEKVPSSLKYYSNVSSNVKETLIKFLNSSIANFSTGFIKAQELAKKSPISLENAPGWDKVLDEIERYNWQPVYEINRKKAFVAPKIKDIANILMNSVGISNIKLEKISPQELTS